MQGFVLPALYTGIPLYAVWMFAAPCLNLMLSMRGPPPGRARSMLAAGVLLIIGSVANVKFASPESPAHLTGILVVAPLLAWITFHALERWDKSKPSRSD